MKILKIKKRKVISKIIETIKQDFVFKKLETFFIVELDSEEYHAIVDFLKSRKEK